MKAPAVHSDHDMAVGKEVVFALKGFDVFVSG